MAIIQALCGSFKEQLFKGEHDISSDTFKLALFDSGADLGAGTTVYSTDDEITGTGYTAGGATMTGAIVTLEGNTAYVDFNDTAWSGATFTANGALIYNASNGDKAVAVIAFGQDISVVAGTYTVEFPLANLSDALIRI